MFFLPGKSYRGPLEPLSEDGRALSSRLSNHVWMLASDIGARSLTSAPENLERAALYIEHVFKSHGFEVSAQEYSVETLTQKNWQRTDQGISFPSVHHKTRNIIAEIKGHKCPEELIVVGAHYDSVYDCPAANDNGSGVAGLLEIAGLLSAEKLKRTIRFVAFTNEEPPFFRTEQMGSYQYARLCKERAENIKAMICLETIGYYSETPNSQRFPHPMLGLVFPKLGNFILLVSNLESKSVLAKAIKSFRSAVKFPSEALAIPAAVKGVAFSDHASFWDFGYPAFMVTDSAFYRYPHYHEPEDTPDKIDYDKLARVVLGLSSVVRDIAGV
jgi:Zn-dependent M28 family amino/carboxypeptidase